MCLLPFWVIQSIIGILLGRWGSSECRKGLEFVMQDYPKKELIAATTQCFIEQNSSLAVQLIILEKDVLNYLVLLYLNFYLHV